MWLETKTACIIKFLKFMKTLLTQNEYVPY